MANFRAVLFATTILLLGTAMAQPISWYVSGTAASGGDGKSWTTAWNSFSAVNWTNINPGDTIYISGGTYTNRLTVGKSGTAGNPITISASSDAGHNSTVIFDFTGISTGSAITVNQNYITITGNVGGANHIQIQNLFNTSTARDAVAIEGSASHLIVDHVTFVNDNMGVSLSSTNPNIEIENCSFQQIRGDAAISIPGSSGTWDTNKIHANYIEQMVNQTTAPGGPDGIQANDGVSVYDNEFKVIDTTAVTSTQHPDTLQLTGSYEKIYNNRFTNIGDSVFDHDCWANNASHDIWIYNNIFRVVTNVYTSVDSGTEFFRFYTSSGSISSINNLKILNNDFIDNVGTWFPIRIDSYNGNPTATGNEIKNNIFYNDGGGTTNTAVIEIAKSTGFSPSSFAFDANVYYQSGQTQYINYLGSSYTAANWVAANEPHGKNGVAPQFVSYVPFADANDFHLQSTDTVAIDAGVDLSAYFNTDKDGTIRPQGSGWDIGAYEFTTGGGQPAAPTGLTATVQ